MNGLVGDPYAYSNPWGTILRPPGRFPHSAAAIPGHVDTVSSQSPGGPTESDLRHAGSDFRSLPSSAVASST